MDVTQMGMSNPAAISLIVGVVAAKVTEWVKTNPDIPFLRPEWINRVRVFVAVLALSGNLLAAYLAGPEKLVSFDWPTWVEAVVGAIGSYLAAELAYHAQIKGTPEGAAPTAPKTEPTPE